MITMSTHTLVGHLLTISTCVLSEKRELKEILAESWQEVLFTVCDTYQ